MTYREAIDWLFGTQTFGIKLGLEGPTRLLREYLAFPKHGTKVIHVAGTNGKGSTCAMIDSVARAAGTRTGLFTSPHLIDFRERIRVSGNDIPEEPCARMLSELRAICDALETHPTFFEITLALAMRWFRERECELLILETGMGGRFDATTAVPADVCVLTPIDLDHTQWLGDTLEKIAFEKAGIFVPGKPVVCSAQPPTAMSVVEKEANQRRCPLEVVTEPLLGYGIALPGAHQRHNAALALAALHHAHVPLNSDIVAHGLSRVSWPGRFEQIRPGITLDGAHNSHSARALANTWREVYPGQKATLIFSAVANKNIAAILSEMAPIARHIHICPVDSPRAATAEEIASHLPDAAPPHTLHCDFPAAFAAARETQAPILVAGSLFLVGEARAHLLDQPHQASAQ